MTTAVEKTSVEKAFEIIREREAHRAAIPGRYASCVFAVAMGDAIETNASDLAEVFDTLGITEDRFRRDVDAMEPVVRYYRMMHAPADFMPEGQEFDTEAEASVRNKIFALRERVKLLRRNRRELFTGLDELCRLIDTLEPLKPTIPDPLPLDEDLQAVVDHVAKHGFFVPGIFEPLIASHRGAVERFSDLVQGKAVDEDAYALRCAIRKAGISSEGLFKALEWIMEQPALVA